MTIEEASLSGLIPFALLLLNFVPCQSVTHYCQNNVIDRISGETEGTIITRNQGESTYGNNVNCMWLIDAGVGKQIKLSIISTDLEWAPTYTTCSGYDNLQIVEGQTDTDNVITALCGSRNPYHVISQGRYIYFTFRTTHQNFGQPRGVELQFQVFESGSCPPGWLTSDNTWCYSVISRGTASWLDAQTLCTYSKANLASITSQDDYSLIYSQGINKSVNRAWIGLNDRPSEGTFSWLDEQNLSFRRNFSSSYPNDVDSDCVAQDFTTGEWTVHRCGSVDLNYICKRRKNGTTTIYFATSSSDTPAQGGDDNNVSFVLIIVIVLVAVILGVIIVVLIVMKQRNPDMCRRKPSAQKQELSTMQYRHSDSTEMTRVAHRRAEPSAPPDAEPVMTFDPQHVAPPTYEESARHQIAPSNY